MSKKLIFNIFYKIHRNFGTHLEVRNVMKINHLNCFSLLHISAVLNLSCSKSNLLGCHNAVMDEVNFFINIFQNFLNLSVFKRFTMRSTFFMRFESHEHIDFILNAELVMKS